MGDGSLLLFCCFFNFFLATLGIRALCEQPYMLDQ